VIASCLVLPGCARSDHQDVLFMTAGPPHVTLDQQRGQWHLLVDGRDVTSDTGVRVTSASAGKSVALSIRVEHETAGLPAVFQLEPHVDGVLYCSRCAAAQRIWRRVEYGKPIQG
jgi:hypothetical protein